MKGRDQVKERNKVMGRIYLISRIMIFLLVASFFLPAQTAWAEGEDLIIIDKTSNQLFFYQKGALAQVFSVATGKTPDLTPEGTFKIANKFVNPYYSAGKIAGGSPKNPLGVRWMGLDVKNTGGSKYGIHGTNDPSSIGLHKSAGCIRMHNQDVIWLYEQIKVGTTVKIVSQAPDLPIPQLSLFGEEINFPQDNQPYYYEQNLMVPLRFLVDQLQYTIAYYQEPQLITISKDQKIAILSIKDSLLHTNIQSYQLAAPVAINAGTTFVSLDLFTYLGYSITAHMPGLHQ